MQDGKTDVIFASRQNYGKCEWTPLYHELLYAILPKNYPLNSRTEFPLKEFEGKRFSDALTAGFDIDLHAAFEKAGVKPKEQTVYVDDETVIRMVGKGLGISMMSELMIRGKPPMMSAAFRLHPKASESWAWERRKGVELPESVRKLKECVVEYTKGFQGRKF